MNFSHLLITPIEGTLTQRWHLTDRYLRWQGKNVTSADNQSSILFQKPNIRTDVQKSSSAQTEAKRKN